MSERLYNAPYNVMIYLGSGERGRKRRERLEEKARKSGFVKNGKVRVAPYVVALIEGKVPPTKD